MGSFMMSLPLTVHYTFIKPILREQRKSIHYVHFEQSKEFQTNPISGLTMSESGNLRFYFCTKNLISYISDRSYGPIFQDPVTPHNFRDSNPSTFAQGNIRDANKAIAATVKYKKAERQIPHIFNY